MCAQAQGTRQVSVPLRGKEGAGQNLRQPIVSISLVSVPLRGKEGAGLMLKVSDETALIQASVSVPLRGKEGAGPEILLDSRKEIC